MAEALNTKLVGHLDCAGGGQVWLDGATAYIAHMHHPDGTSIVDVSNPREPRVLAHLEIPKGWHSHKVRVVDGVMLVNHERQGHDNPDFGGGILYWRRVLKGRVKAISQRLVEEGHCSRINYKDYKTMSAQQQIRNLPQELDANYSLEEVTKRLGIGHLLG